MFISFEEQLNIKPRLEYLPQYDPHRPIDASFWTTETAQIRAIAYEGPKFQGKRTKVFAYTAFPQNCNFPVPAVVLVHGGGCHPDCAWIEEWTARGYAVIAPDTTGYFPGEFHTSFTENNRGNWKHELPEEISAPGYTVSPDNSGMQDWYTVAGDQWMYHAVSQILLAHNILREDARIEHGKIGICGISWGGVITSIAIGYDARFAFAVPIYGSAYLVHGLTKHSEPFHLKENEMWLAERKYEQMNTPVMWLCWNDDFAFSINSVSHSYICTVKNNVNTVLSIRHLMYHSHTCAVRCRESYWFAECILNGDKVPRISAAVDNRTLTFYCSERPREIRLFYITDKLSYVDKEKYGISAIFIDEEWKIRTIDTASHQVELPDDAAEFYLEFTFENDIVLCSKFFEKPV